MNVERRVVDTPRIIENHAGQPCYLVEYDEDQWNKYATDGQEHCFTEWIKRAKPLGAHFVVLRLFPDPVFPQGEHTVPYVARSIPIDMETFNPLTISVKISGEIHADTWAHASELERHNLKTAARTQLGMNALAHKGCSYDIWTRAGGGAPYVIEKGKF